MAIKYETHIIVPPIPKEYNYIEWLIENGISEYDYRAWTYKNFSDHTIILYYIFWFINLEDAMAFKLRWG